ncbi:MAG TPA: hypothetical protein VN656_15560 [Stellaceae bacterium]|nr:hypothetical protein [Stellaceae bacterium]
MRLSLIALSMSLLVLAVAMPAEAETFDCRQPTMPLGRLICNDAALRTADAEESDVYDAALLASLDRPSLRDEERVWFDHEILPYNWFAQQHMPVDNSKVAEIYRRRSTALREETRDWRKLRHSVPSATLATTCLALPQRSGDCTVAAFAPIEGVPTLRYQQQTYAQPAASSVIVILAAVPDHPDGWLPLAVASSAHPLTQPQAIASPAGTLLVIAGNGDSDASALYRLDKDALQDIDDRSWLETLRSRLPDGLALSSDIVADYGKMQAASKVTRSQSTCCAVGSTATIDLTIENDRVVVSGVTFGEPSGSPNDHAN